MILLVVFISANNASARTINVNAAGGGDYTTIQAAINAASAGDTVYVYNGTYNEQITISKNIDLVGQSNQSTIIRGTGASNTKGISITTNFVNISNMRVDNFDYGILLTSSSTNILTNTNITNSGTYDISLKTSSSFKSINSTFVPTVETLTTLSAKLPSGRYWASAIWDGTNAYIFGGCDGNIYLDQIVKFNPNTGAVTTLTTKLPSRRGYTSAIWDGTNVYIFGGWDGFTALDQIVKFNPNTGLVTTLTSKLPDKVCYTSAIWDGTNAYIFGGVNQNGNNVDEIIKFNPTTGTATRLNAKLPSERRSTSAIWDGTNAYIFGGSDGTNILDQIVKFNPNTGLVTTLTAKLPTGRYGTSAIWDGTNAYVFAGVDGSNTKVDIITRFNPTTGAVTTLSTKLPSGRIHTLSVWDGTSAYILGGFLSVTEASDQIVKFTPGKIYCDATSKLEIANYLQVSVMHASNSSMKWARVEIRDNDNVVFNGYTDANGIIDWLLTTKRTYTSGAVTENRTKINVYSPGYSFNNNNRAVDAGMAHIEFFIANESSACYIGDNFTEDFDNSYYIESSNKINISGGNAQVSLQSQQTTGQTTGLVAYWSFDEGSGQTASDSSGNGNAGTLGSSSGSDSSDPTWVDGKFEKGLSFDGIDDYVNIGDKFNNIALPLSITAWIYRPDGGGGFVFCSDDEDTYHGFWFVVYGTSISINYGDGTGSGPGARRAKTSDLTIPSNTWLHVVAIVRGPIDMSLYINGEDVGGNYSGSGGDITHATSPARIGKHGSGYFKGKIDEVRIYNCALSASEISAKYARYSGLVAYWSFDEGTGTAASDSSGNGNTGMVYGGAAWVDGISGKALQFDGGGDYVAVPGSASLSTVGAITVELWMKTSVGDTNFIIQKYDNVGTNPYGYALHFAIAGHPDKLEFWDGVSWSRVTTTHITDDAWHHVVVTGNGSAGVFYIDGIVGPSFTFHTVSDSPSEILYMGAFEGIGSFFNGLIDEVRIYNRALSADEVYAAYVNTINSNFVASPIFPYNITSYDDLTCNASINTAQNQSITVFVLDADTNQILLTSNITDGISETSLSIISPLAHPAIKFNFAFASAGTSSPSLYSYSISWLRHSKPEVNVTFIGLVNDNAMVVEAYNAFNAIVSAYSLNGISLYEWDIDGDGTYEYSNTSLGNKTINFTTTGNKVISLRVTDGSGIQAAESYTFTVVPNLGPQINAVFYNLYTLTNLTITDLTIPQGRNFAVNVSAQDKDGIGSIKIDPYSDGNQVATSINKTYCNATWHYDNTGNYTLKVNATDGVGMESEKTYIIHVLANLLPTANFTIPANWSANSPLQLFSSSSDADGSIANYAWNFGDGNNSYESSPEHTWSSKGNFDITLTIIDDLGGMDSIKQTLLIVNAAPLIALSANTTTAQTYETIKFYETSVMDTDGYVVLHSYDFGDGTLVNITDSGITSIEHNYTAKGTYNVTLRVYDNDGGYAVKKIAVTIINTPPTFVYVPTNLSASSLTSLKFNATVQDIDGTVVNYTWNFGDNSLDNLAYAQTSLHSYSMSGNYTASLTITDNDGGTAVKSTSVTITNRPPACSFTASSGKKPAEELTFTANATDSDGVIVKYKWDFGDKNSTEWVDNGVIKHTYMRAGKYNASLIVMDNNGAESAVAYDTVTVVNIPPVAVIVRPKYVYIDEETQFLGNGSKDTYGSIISYRWDFDDGTTSTEINPKHTYKKVGTYKISLTVTDDSGDTDKENETIEIIAQAQTPPGGGEKDIIEYLDLYANIIGLLIALVSVAGGYIILRKKRGVLGRQMTLVENSMKMQNPIERYRRLCDIQKASSKLLQRGKISESNYMILDNKIRDYKNVLEKKHPDIEKVAELQKIPSPYQQSETEELKLDTHGEYKNE
ncbi:MAG: PKD domain-containing protein [Thermoplasmata archaeon]